eukprot:TRINITY_DN1102_c0_g1_i5.p1 TRINITY_DN1102_c0_g1~~TRINITY_DN1102_c0_g1_i5.p1  ORF type:complete len:570 (+),score=81.22 TRINITY_DN1102_c0_g1_i5:2-1711(+)
MCIRDRYQRRVHGIYSMEKGKSEALKGFSIVDPFTLSEKAPAKLTNLVDGKWKETKSYKWVIDPMNGEKFIEMPNTNDEELKDFAESLRKIPKTGLHNPLKNVGRYVMYGEICRKAAELLNQEDIINHWVKLIQRIVPKSTTQAFGEIKIVRNFLANFSGDQVRFLAEGTRYPGDHDGQHPTGYRWPFGAVAVVSPFNFPLEIPAMQMLGALFMGNKVIVKANSKTTIIMEEFVRMLIYCGMPLTDCDLIHCAGDKFEKLYSMVPIRMTQFTGSGDIAERLAELTKGKVKLEDAGFDWKILGPDAHTMNIDYLAWQCDQDAYALTGQKCSAESFLMVHKNLAKTDFYEKLKAQAAKRNLADLSVGPVLSVKQAEFEAHRDGCMKCEGARILFGGKPLTGHTIPSCYGAWEPSAYLIPLKHFLNPEHFPVLTTEVFGPVQVVTEYDDDDIDTVIKILETVPQHLTAAVVSNDPVFNYRILANTVNGTTYYGYKARTTGAPQNHWFGPCGDPRCAGIGTPEAIRLVWSAHREIICDELPPSKDWTVPKPTQLHLTNHHSLKKKKKKKSTLR